MLNKTKTHFYEVALTHLKYLVNQLHPETALGGEEMAEMAAYLTIIGDSKEIPEDRVWYIHHELTCMLSKLQVYPKLKLICELMSEVTFDLSRRYDLPDRWNEIMDQVNAQDTCH